MELTDTQARKILSTPCWALERRLQRFKWPGCLLVMWNGMAGKEGWPGMVKDHSLFRAPCLPKEPLGQIRLAYRAVLLDKTWLGQKPIYVWYFLFQFWALKLSLIYIKYPNFSEDWLFWAQADLFSSKAVSKNTGIYIFSEDALGPGVRKTAIAWFYKIVS